MPTRIALFSDIHSNLPAMEAVRDHIARGGYDAVYCLGDIGGYAAQPNEVQDLTLAMNCPTLMGNYDESVGADLDDCGCSYVKPLDISMSKISFEWTRANTTAEHKAWLRGLPRELRINVGGLRILLCHGSPRSTTEYLFEKRSDGFLSQFAAGGKLDAGADVVVCGHTHVPYHRSVEGVRFINTGSVGRPKDGDPRAGYCVMTIDGESVTTEQIRLPYDVEATCSRILKAGLPEFFAEYLRTGGNITPTLQETR